MTLLQYRDKLFPSLGRPDQVLSLKHMHNTEYSLTFPLAYSEGAVGNSRGIGKNQSREAGQESAKRDRRVQQMRTLRNICVACGSFLTSLSSVPFYLSI